MQGIMGASLSVDTRHTRYGTREYAMGRANIREYAMVHVHANTLWVARIRYGKREYAMGRANTLWVARIRYGKREYAMGRANTLWYYRNPL